MKNSHYLFHGMFAFLFYGISQFCLWNISRYLTTDHLMAYLLFPSGLRLAVGLLAPNFVRWVCLGTDLLLAGVILWLLSATPVTYFMFIFPILSFSLAAICGLYKAALLHYWQKLLLLMGLMISHALFVGIVFFLLSKPLALSFIDMINASVVTLTGAVVVTPFLYLLSDYLKHQIWLPLTPSLIHQDVRLSPWVLVWSLFFFSLGLLAELVLLEQMKPLALLIIILPNIFLAYRYGWQGGVLASVMNSILLAAARQVSGSFSSEQELLIFMASQSLVGLGLGIAISRQHSLAKALQQANQRLATQLMDKQRLARQLITIEEEVRKSVARELHDDIGQNITAIQIQARLTERLASTDPVRQSASQIHHIAMNIHQATRQLLKRLRPHLLDELGLESAIRQLIQDMRFAEHGINVLLNIGLDSYKLDDMTSVTLFRMLQELLNNIAKHAQASEVQITLFPGSDLTLEVKDNGIGLPDDWSIRGHGLIGIRERVSALGGDFSVLTSQRSGQGMHIVVNLPTK
ncbi:sensor protein UhpB [Vibrio metschnikovii]|uniref:signal transduction histidine-protein kinase/phosphatase UhpB n=1 Tax=Vibrio metschnikovii TaxID=28172 RepID=UPI0001B9578F|nr:signal transduction histidine-protein kinase/phosphatase UhpB [Vibrio metschnikovii]EEX35740.1 sensor histidine protein kinase UhpB glucose-6-phosphate specific [Vibrio metschnikovii CIP 69.14]SUP07896.1 sensor protein UhpB [Vibrio metschnikovii]SUP47174.1 sensor protein UhpB [Vibrio metschnikovii]